MAINARNFFSSIRTRLMAVSLVLLLIPYLGYRFVTSMEAFLRESQERSLTDSSRLLAATLSERPYLLARRAVPLVKKSAPVITPPTALPDAIATAPQNAPALGTPLTPPSDGVAAGVEVTPLKPTPQPEVMAQAALPTAPPTITAEFANERAQILAVFGSDDPEAASQLGSLYVPSEEIERILKHVQRDASRMWVFDKTGKVRALVGSFKMSLNQPAIYGARGSSSNGGGVLPAPPEWLNRVLSWVVPSLTGSGTSTVGDDPVSRANTVLQQADRALLGNRSTQWRQAIDKQTVILSAAQPIWADGEIVGAAVVEETTGAIALLKTTALQNLLLVGGVVFLVGFLTLFLFAARLTQRIRRLSRQADAAIDAQGRLDAAQSFQANKHTAKDLAAPDEIGDLARALNNTMTRLSSYNHYLENMGSRLAHELRTPVAVVRSSLDNLKASEIGEAQTTYVNRAHEGVTRLSGLISRLSEGTQLERFLSTSEKEKIDLVALLIGAVTGYAQAYPQQKMVFEHAGIAMAQCVCVPDALVQMLDKLVDNARDFATPETPIVVSLRPVANSEDVEISVANQGAALSKEIESTLFESMISMRTEGNANKAGHLGLGLYIVRLIAHHHHGVASARNLLNAQGVAMGVEITVQIPLTPLVTPLKIGRFRLG